MTSAIISGLIGIIAIILKYLFSKKRAEKKRDEEFEKAIATNDHDTLSDDLDSSFTRVRKANRRSSK